MASCTTCTVRVGVTEGERVELLGGIAAGDVVVRGEATTRSRMAPASRRPRRGAGRDGAGGARAREAGRGLDPAARLRRDADPRPGRARADLARPPRAEARSRHRLPLRHGRHRAARRVARDGGARGHRGPRGAGQLDRGHPQPVLDFVRGPLAAPPRVRSRLRHRRQDPGGARQGRAGAAAAADRRRGPGGPEVRPHRRRLPHRGARRAARPARALGLRRERGEGAARARLGRRRRQRDRGARSERSASGSIRSGSPATASRSRTWPTRCGARTPSWRAAASRAPRASGRSPRRARRASVGEFGEIIVAERDGPRRPAARRRHRRRRHGRGEERRQASTATPGVALEVQQQSGSDLVAAAREIRVQLDKIRAQAPPGVEITVARDYATIIEEQISSVLVDMLLAAALVVAVVLCFLRNYRSTLIAGDRDPGQRDRQLHAALRARPLAQQHDADGALARGRPRDRRRHRRAREHLPEGRAGPGFDERGALRLAGSGHGGGLHDPGRVRRLRSDPLHAEHRGPLLLRVRRHRHGRRLRVGARRAHAHADAREPRAAADAQGRPGLPLPRARPGRARARLRAAAARRAAPPHRDRPARRHHRVRRLLRRLDAPAQLLHQGRHERGAGEREAADRHAARGDRPDAARRWRRSSGSIPTCARCSRRPATKRQHQPHKAKLDVLLLPKDERDVPDRHDLRGAAREHPRGCVGHRVRDGEPPRVRQLGRRGVQRDHVRHRGPEPRAARLLRAADRGAHEGGSRLPRRAQLLGDGAPGGATRRGSRPRRRRGRLLHARSAARCARCWPARRWAPSRMRASATTCACRCCPSTATTPPRST